MKKILLISIIISLFIVVSYSYSEGAPCYKKTLLSRLKPNLPKKEFKKIASEYGCSISKVHRSNYDESPHTIVKFFIQEEGKTPFDVVFEAEEDKRIISLTPDMKGKRFLSQGEDLDLTDASYTEIRKSIVEGNRDMLGTMGWFKAEEYFKNHYDGPVNKEDVDTIIIFIDTGVAKESWVRKTRYLLPGGDVVGEDDDPADYEDVEFKYRHGEIMAQELATLTPNTGLSPIKTSFAGEGPTLSNMKKGLELAFRAIRYLEKEVGRDYNIIVNGTSGISEYEISAQLMSDWKQEGEKLFPRFKEQNKDKLEQRGYNVGELEYNDMLVKDEYSDFGISVEDERLYEMAESWLKSKHEMVKWDTIEKMKKEGWLINGPAGDTQGEKIYPSATKEVEAIDRAEAERGFAYPISPHGDWAKRAAPRGFKVYNPQKDTLYEAEGTCPSTAFVSSLEARLWNLSPNLNNKELEKIVRDTTTEIKSLVFEDAPSKQLVHPYRAMRVSHVYGEIKEYVRKYNNDKINFIELKKDIETILDDTKSTTNFSDIGTINEIFSDSSKDEIKPLSDILNIIIADSKKIVPDVGEMKFSGDMDLDYEETESTTQKQSSYQSNLSFDLSPLSSTSLEHKGNLVVDQ